MAKFHILITVENSGDFFSWEVSRGTRELEGELDRLPRWDMGETASESGALTAALESVREMWAAAEGEA